MAHGLTAILKKYKYLHTIWKIALLRLIL